MIEGLRGRLVGALGGALLLVTSCGSDDNGPRSVSTADAYSTAIRWLADNTPTPDTTEGADAAPFLVYIAPADGNGIDAGTQAAVVQQLSDMSDVITVIFADVRDDAINVDATDQHVKGEGALLLVGKVVEGPPPVEVDIEVYRSLSEDETFQMRIVRAGTDDYTVTAVTQVAQS